MKERSLLVWIGILILISATTMAAQQGMKVGPLILKNAPASLVGTRHTTTDFLNGAVLENKSTQAIISYRIGWVASAAPGKGRIVLTGTVRQGAIGPGTTAEVPPQKVSPESIAKNARSLGFFVAEVKFVDGKRWKASRSEIIKAADQLLETSKAVDTMLRESTN